MPLFNNVLLVEIRNSQFVCSMPSFQHFLCCHWHLISRSLSGGFSSDNRRGANFIDLATTFFLIVTDINNQIGNMTRYNLVFSLIISRRVSWVWILCCAIIICIYTTSNLTLKFFELGLFERPKLNLEVMRWVTGLGCIDSVRSKNSVFGFGHFFGAWSFHVHVIAVLFHLLNEGLAFSGNPELFGRRISNTSIWHLEVRFRNVSLVKRLFQFLLVAFFKTVLRLLVWDGLLLWEPIAV